jgi:hypothetical protein
MGLNIALWIAQVLLLGLFGYAGIMKVVRTPDQLRPMMAWVDDYSGGAIKLIGVAEILGAIGMVLPMLTGILPWLTPLAAVGFIIIQILGVILHVRRGEMQVLPFNAVLTILSLFVLWGRWDLFGF